MKHKTQKELLAALQTLDQFASQTPLPRTWHAQWQTLYQQVVANMTLYEKFVKDAEPAGNGQEP